jgi:ABC-type bacteriocin/lantibiotic exporter with double-glycine peptidase domain
MVLEAFGKDIDESELRRLCNTTELGTFANDIVSCAIELGFNSEKTYLVVDDLKRLIEEDIFPIVYVNTYSLNGIFATHAIIVEEIEDGEVMIIDPLEDTQQHRNMPFLVYEIAISLSLFFPSYSSLATVSISSIGIHPTISPVSHQRQSLRLHQ